MRFSAEKKQSVILYIMEKIDQRTENLSAYVSEQLGIGRNTVHNYLKELLEQGIIRKNKRDCYELAETVREFRFGRGDREMIHDTYVFESCLSPMIEALPRNIEHIWNYGVSEMVNNVIDHSGADEMTVTVVRNALYTRVVIRDNGIGIFRKIMEHFALTSEEEAVCELFKGKLTTDARNHSGEGIFFTSKMMDSFYILSGETVFTTTKYETDSITCPAFSEKGTCVSMTLSNYTNRTAVEVFDRYAGNDGDFSRTGIPIRNVFDKAPISRSQAKRLCNRLDQFREIELDFHGVEWMGQGFAHQLFVIYAEDHPEISLVPLNMSPEVQRMYRHVVQTEPCRGCGTESNQ